MKIFTLWHEGEDGDRPWLVSAVDDDTIEVHNGFPAEYVKLRQRADHRELVLVVPDKAVCTLFESPVVKVEIAEETS